MINSGQRKLTLSGWLKNRCRTAYDAPLRMQKFLFFYEAFSKIDGESPDFSHLRGYKRGPVFSNVWGDYTKDRAEFNNAVDNAYHSNADSINEERAEKSAFLVQILSEDELSDLSHSFNIWAKHKKEIDDGIQQVTLSVEDLDSNDEILLHQLEEMYPLQLIKSSVIIPVNDMNFVFNKDNIERLSERHMDILSVLSRTEQLRNPVFVEIDEDGGMSVD